jgi:hypothetical protein
LFHAASAIRRLTRYAADGYMPLRR